MILLERINKKYSKGVTAIDGINLQISGGSIVAIIGANGSGKSTLLKIIAGQVKPSQGKVSTFGCNTIQPHSSLKNKTTYISQEKNLDPEMTGMELLQYFSALYGLSGKFARQNIMSLIDNFSMKTFVHRKVSGYSGGQKQRLHIAVGVIHNPELLLLDEPGSALDPEGKALIWNFICRSQQQGSTTIIVDHDLESIRQHCTRVILLDQGHIIADDTPAAIIKKYSKPLLQFTTQYCLATMQPLVEFCHKQWPDSHLSFNNTLTTLKFSDISEKDRPTIMLKLLQFFYNNHIVVTECFWHQPGLAAAYFQLTGKKADKPPQNQNKHQKRTKGRRH